MVENSLRAVCHRLKEDHPPYSPTKHFLSLLSSNHCAMHVTCTYALHLLERRELRSLTLLLPLIAAGFSQSEGAKLPDVFLHLLVVRLTGQPEAIREASLQVGALGFQLSKRDIALPAIIMYSTILIDGPGGFHVLPFLQAILRDFWLPCSRSSEPALLHCCRLLWVLHSRLSPRGLEEVLEALMPGDQVRR